LASEFVSKSIAIREEIGDVLGVARSYNNLGNLGWKSGLWDDALVNFKRSAEMQTRLGDAEGIIDLNTNLGALQIDRGYTDEARRYLDIALARAEQIGHNFHIALANHNLSLLFTATENWSSALEYGLRSEALFKSLGEKANLVDVYVNLGVIYLGLRDLVSANRCGEQALTLLDDFASGSETVVRGCALRLLGDVALVVHDIESSKKYYHQAELIFEQVGNRLERGRLLMSVARLAMVQSNRPLASSCLSLAKKLFEQLGARLDLKHLAMLRARVGLAPAA
jgi:tetratricopeptide (TPR) repeat protein